MKTEKIYTQHEENKQWMNSLMFYTDDIKIMKGRLAEVAAKNTSKDVLAQVEHFQNQFVIQSNNIDTLKHEINLSNDAINKDINHNSTAVDHRKIQDHTTVRESMESFEKNIKGLRSEFNEFIGKWI